MERVVKKLDVVGPRILWKIVQSVDKTSEVAVSEKTERARELRSDCRVAALATFGWPMRATPAISSAFEFPFHRGERDRLMIANHLGLCVAGWKRNEKRRDQANERSRAQIKSRLDWMNSAQGVKRSDRGDDERAGHDRGQLIMRELNQRPRIQKIRAHAGDA